MNDEMTKPLSPKALRLVKELEKQGHRNVCVWWEPVGAGAEMCGPSGGWLFTSDVMDCEEFLGLNFDAALYAVRNTEWRYLTEWRYSKAKA